MPTPITLYLLGLVSGFILGVGSGNLFRDTVRMFRIIVCTYILVALGYLIVVRFRQLL
jgi:Na+/citrate or Na+/malate symporter